MKYDNIKFLVIALRDSVEIYAWAPRPYHKFMAFKVSFTLLHRPSPRKKRNKKKNIALLAVDGLIETDLQVYFVHYREGSRFCRYRWWNA